MSCPRHRFIAPGSDSIHQEQQQQHRHFFLAHNWNPPCSSMGCVHHHTSTAGLLHISALLCCRKTFTDPSSHRPYHPQVEEFELPSPQRVCALVLLSYFFVTAGIAYDIINEPPAIGARQDPVTGTAHSSRGRVIEAASSKYQL